MDRIRILKLEDTRLDFFNVAKIESTMLKLMKEEAKAILIDMTRVEYADSRAIGLFVGFKIQCDSKNIKLALFNLSEDVKYIFKVTAVDTAINIYENEEVAIKEINEQLDA